MLQLLFAYQKLEPPSVRVGFGTCMYSTGTVSILGRCCYSRGTVDKTPSKPFRTQGFQNALAEAGATPDKMARVVNEAMDARAVVTYRGEAKESDAPDHAIRLRAADQLADLTGAKITRVQVQSVNVNLDGGDLLAAMGL